MASTSPIAVAADNRRLRHVVEYLAESHGVELDPAEVDAAARRAAVPSQPAIETVRTLAAAAGLTTAVVRRALADVLADADPAYPWLTLRSTGEGLEALAVLEAARGGASVMRPGVDLRPVRWGARRVLEWMGVPDAAAEVDWILAEPAAPLSLMRTREGSPTLTPFERLRALLRAERSTLWVAVVYSVVIALLALVVPIAVQSLVNTIAFGSVIQPLVVLTLFVFVALGFSTVMNALRAGVVEIIQRSVFARVATDVTWRLLRVRADAFDRYHGPELVNRFFDTVTVQKAAALLLIDGLSILMQTAIGMVLIAFYHPWLLAFDVVLVAAMLVIVFVLGRGAVPTAIGESKAKFALQGWLEHLAEHLVTFKSAGGAEYARVRSQRLLEDYLSYRRKHFRILLRQIVGSFALQAGASAALLGVGGWLVIERQLTLGQLVASELVVAGMLSAFTKFGKQLEVFYDLAAAIDKLGSLVDLPLERAGGEATIAATGPAALAVRDLDVGYANGVRRAVAIDALDIAPGQHIGITGPNGSGKSTLADVLFGLRAQTSGSVRLDGVDLRSLSLPELRRHVALVRAVELFPGTVMENVRLGRDHLSHAQVVEALQAVDLLEELLALPDGLDTELHPHGRPLSSRQACRLMIARAVAGRPRLLVLDGALDPVDDDLRDKLAETLLAADAPWTVVCITERADLLARCAQVVRLAPATPRHAPKEPA
jgi:ABC-type bacteriocin/lantibiotic exporter with double-glycine peptidase domain